MIREKAVLDASLVNDMLEQLYSCKETAGSSDREYLDELIGNVLKQLKPVNSRKDLKDCWELIEDLAYTIDRKATKHGTQAERNDAYEIRRIAETRLSSHDLDTKMYKVK